MRDQEGPQATARSIRELFADAARAHREGRAQDAERIYRQILAIDPHHSESLHGIGVLAYQARQSDRAVPWLRQALAVRGDLATYHNSLGLALGALGQSGEAIACFERAISLQPGFAKAHNNLGVAYLSQDRCGEAAAQFERALALDPGYVSAHVNLGNALARQEKFAAATAAFERALALEPAHPEAYANLGVSLMWQGEIDAAFAAFRRHAGLRFGRGATHAEAQARRDPEAPHKLGHDREQLAYLLELRPEDQNVRRVRDEAARAPDRFARLFDGLFHLEGGSRCDPSALSPAIDARAIEARWDESRPQIVVVDDLLTPAALEELRRFCCGSTVWRDARPNGYIGAFLRHGFACPLLAQIAGELSDRLPRVIRKRPLTQIWGFKYDRELRGISVHADVAAVNVNFWITADDANLDPDGGGLVIWDVPAPLDWSFARYQNNDPQEIRKFLEAERAQTIVVPYRANRAVIFDSDLFHETDRFVFKEGYANRRINITLLYGRRHDDGSSG